jgi:flagellar protein FlaG
MRIDMVQPQPIPDVPKVAEGNKTSTSYDNFNRQLQEYAAGGDAKKNDKVSGKSIKDGVDKINEKLQESGKRIQFKILKDPNRVITQIVDSTTNEVIEEIPSKKLLEIINAIGKTSGQNMDKKA